MLFLFNVCKWMYLQKTFYKFELLIYMTCPLDGLCMVHGFNCIHFSVIQYQE